MRKNLLFLAVVSLLAIFGFSGVARAGYAFVDCQGNPEEVFTSINVALNSLTPDDPYWNWIEVVGTCTESVLIHDHRKLGIVAPWGETATIVSPDRNSPALGIWHSRGIYLYGLVLKGGSNGLVAGAASDIMMENCIAENNASNGITIRELTMFSITGTQLRNNGGSGLGILNNSVVVTWGGGLEIRDNGGIGVEVVSGMFYTLGGTIVEGNGGPGFFVNTGIASLGGVTSGGNIVRGNQGGASVWQMGMISFWGQNLVQNNGPYGVRAYLGAQAEFLGWGAPWIATVEGHTDVGVEVRDRGQAFFWGPNVIRNNGSGHPSAGVRVDQTSQLTMQGGNQITNNLGAGIFTDINSSLDLSDITISGNTGPGVLALHQSVAELGTGTVLGSNGGGALNCDRSSLVLTNLFRPGLGCQSIEPPSGRPKPHYTPTLPEMPNLDAFENSKDMYQRLRNSARGVR